ncbi:MAG: ATP-grasp domain-containing protein [Bacteroidales bacterium]|nr:ATP-grasp domain-containing protein [Bacteroidales bacterium]
MKKLLILGAMEMHVPLILRAKERGIYTITCDYIPENPGHKIADEAYYDSTTDLNAVLKLAQRLGVDGIMTYNSDPAAPTVAYVAEQLGLPGNPYNAVKTMSEKDLFRKFLLDNGLNVPKCFVPENLDNIKESDFPLIVKPVDSSGSKGVTIIRNISEIHAAISAALQKSRCKRFVIEEYIEPIGHQLHGDGFVEDGKITFLALGDHHFDNSINNLVPYSTTFPSEHSAENIKECKQQIQEFISKVGFKNGGFNVELRVSKKDNKAYIIDIGARNGGNFTPKVIQYYSGFNFLDRAINVALGEPTANIPTIEKASDFVSYLILHSSRSGILNNIEISPEIEKRIIEKHIYVKSGEEVEPFFGANAALGVLIMKYESRQKMNDIVDNFSKLYKVEVKVAKGNNLNLLPTTPQNGYWSEVRLYADKDGIFKELKFSESLKNQNIRKIDLWVHAGDKVEAFKEANNAIGTLVLKFETNEELEKVLSNQGKYFQVVVE